MTIQVRISAYSDTSLSCSGCKGSDDNEWCSHRVIDIPVELDNWDQLGCSMVQIVHCTLYTDRQNLFSETNE